MVEGLVRAECCSWVLPGWGLATAIAQLLSTEPALWGQESKEATNGAKRATFPRFPVTVAFTPMLEGELVFNLKCDVKRKTQPLSLNIKATGYSTNVCVRCEDSDGRVMELSTQKINVIDFKEVSGSVNNLPHEALQDWALTGSFAGTFEQQRMFFFIYGSLEGEVD